MKALVPPSFREGDNPRPAILNIILSFSIGAFILLNIIRIIDHIVYSEECGLPLWSTLLILAFLLWLRHMSRRGKMKLASILLIMLYSLPAAFSLIAWGADLPAGLLLCVLIIIMSVALLEAKAAFVTAIIVSGFLISLTAMQNSGFITVSSYWRQENNQIGDAIAYTILLLVIAGIIWLFAHGIRQMMLRARRSEMALKEERDSLEMKVAERTREIRQMEQEKIGQLYRLAEFGKLSSGIFHDLVNPLTAISFNLEQAHSEAEKKRQANDEISRAKTCLDQAMLAAHRMEGLIAGVKRQIQKESGSTDFLPREEIKEVIQILAYKARRAGVRIIFLGNDDFSFAGDAIKFGQIITNILANAIDASVSGSQDINISLAHDSEGMKIAITDRGTGIAPENMEKIFEPFFSTKKKNGQGLGIGLSLTKDIVEKSFGGTISVTSRLGAGTSFFITLPFIAAKDAD